MDVHAAHSASSTMFRHQVRAPSFAEDAAEDALLLGAPDVERGGGGVVHVAQNRRAQVGDRQELPRAEMLGGDGMEPVAHGVEVAEERVRHELNAGSPGGSGAKEPRAL